jgi:ankyrin repeat protein
MFPGETSIKMIGMHCMRKLKIRVLVVMGFVVSSIYAMDHVPVGGFSDAVLEEFAAASVGKLMAYADAITPLCEDSPELEELMQAISDQSLEKVKDCISRGVNVNARSSNDFGVSPLEAAVYTGNISITQALIVAGANVHILSSITKDSLLVVALSNITQDSFNNFKMITYLLSKGVSPRTGRYAPLLCAIRNKLADIVALLMQAGALYTIQDQEDKPSTWTLVIQTGNELVWKTFLNKCTDAELCSMCEAESSRWVRVKEGLKDVLSYVRAEQADRLRQAQRWSPARAEWLAALARASELE